MGRKARDKKDRPRFVDAAQPAQAPHAAVRAARTRNLVALPEKAGLWAIALAILAAVCYLNALDTPFLLDDPINIGKNPVIQRPLSLAHLLLDQRAVVTASLRINYASSALAVASYHLLNLSAHILAGWLLFALAYVTLRLPVFETRYARAAEPLAATIAAVFLLHPVQTESVTYIIQRSEIFVSAALVAALLGFIAIDAKARRPGPLGFFAAACLIGAYSKPSFAVAPALLLLYDLCFLSRGRIAGLRDRWPAYAIAAGAAAWTFVLTTTAGSFEARTAGFSIEGIDPLQYFRAQIGVVVIYLRVLLWPSSLCFDCGYQGPWPVLASALGNSVALPAAILGALGAAALALWRFYPLATFAVIGSALALAPTSTFVPLADFYVEHRIYLAIGLVALALVPAVFDLSGALATRTGLSSGALRGTRRALAGIVLAALAMLTVARNQVFADPLRLLLDTVSKAPQSERTQYNLANEYKRRGEQDKAIERYKEAIRLSPHVARSYMNLGGIYLDQQRNEEAMEIFLAGSQNVPKMAMTHRNLAVAYARLGRYADSLAAAQRSLTVEPNNATGHNVTAQAFDQLNRRAEAIAEYEKVLELEPGHTEAKKRLQTLQAD
ncbi:MAG: tetratricopeptide repeat protein [Deltaproteobacteria bacterium]|nr:tetratricopeptide repeat protein [Deltaproteobacteria bacterium]